MTITASTLVAVDDTPASDGTSLWAPVAVFLPNWEREVRINTSFRTSIKPSRSQSEQRFGKVTKPFRSMVLNLRSLDRNARELLRAQLIRGAPCSRPLAVVL